MMARERESLTIQILREIQANLVSVQVKLNEHDRRFEALEVRMDNSFTEIQTQIDHRFDRWITK